MGSLPTLKLGRWRRVSRTSVSWKFVSAVRTSSIGIRTVEERRFPFHAGRDISPTLLRKIAKDIGLTVEQLLGRA